MNEAVSPTAPAAGAAPKQRLLPRLIPIDTPQLLRVLPASVVRAEPGAPTLVPVWNDKPTRGKSCGRISLR